MAKMNWERELLEEVLAHADPSWMGTDHWEFRGEVGRMRFTLLAKRKKNGKWRMMGWHEGW